MKGVFVIYFICTVILSYCYAEDEKICINYTVSDHSCYEFNDNCRSGEICFEVRFENGRFKRDITRHSQIEEKAHLVQLPKALRLILKKLRQDKRKLSGNSL